jgi:ABC-2 type transport system permease protein
MQALRRILAVIRKELAALWSDPKTRSVILVPPLIQVVVFAYAATYDVTRVPLAIWNEDGGTQAAELVRQFDASPAFAVSARVDNPLGARAVLDAKDVVAVLHVPQDFSADLLAGRAAQAQLLLDARRSNTALMAAGYASAIAAAYVQSLRPGQKLPFELRTRYWFNPTLDSQWFILPGLVGIISVLMAMLISSLSLARERELGTFEQLLVTPLGPAEILVGKAVPGVVVGLIDANLAIAASLLWFHVPFHGDFLALQLILLLAMLAGVGIGLAVSSITHTQQQAMLGMFLFASPMIVLSGYAAPVENMPKLVQTLTLANPLRWLLVETRGFFLADLPPGVALAHAWPLAPIAAVTLLVAGLAVRRATV